MITARCPAYKLRRGHLVSAGSEGWVPVTGIRGTADGLYLSVEAVPGVEVEMPSPVDRLLSVEYRREWDAKAA
jgi:hypothetical protein